MHIQPFWKKKWKDKICGITHSRLRPGKNKYGYSYSVFLNCKHGFYRSVIIEWINQCTTKYPTCPICRKIININKII